MMTDLAISDIFRVVLMHSIVVAIRSPRRPKLKWAFGVFAC